MVNSEGTILYKTAHERGRKHDYEVFKNRHPITPPQVENVLDLGYLGVQNDFPHCKVCMYCHLERKEKEEKVNSQMKKRNTIESILS